MYFVDLHHIPSENTKLSTTKLKGPLSRLLTAYIEIDLYIRPIQLGLDVSFKTIFIYSFPVGTQR